jgi:hypothetical protein
LHRYDVEGMDRLLKAVTKEKEVAEAASPARGDSSNQSVDNNFRGLRLEFECAELLSPGVVAVRKRFASRPPSLGAKLEDDDVVEVDVVAQGGLLWVECKAEKGDVSPNVVLQALAMQKMARAPCNRRHFGRKAPEVAVYLTGTLGGAEAESLREAGIWVLRRPPGGGEITAAGSAEGVEGLPAVPPPPVLANLDITALFALVSEVSNIGGGGARDPDSRVDPAVREWADRKPQHAACLDQELEQPLRLADKLKGYERLVAHPSVVERFLKILHTVGGPRERRRWQDEWSARILVTAPRMIEGDIEEVDVDTSRGKAKNSSGSSSGGSISEREAWRRSVRGLTRISEPQKDAFELGEAEMAKTFTANSRAVTLAAEQGVFLEAYVFKAIWLVGL